VFEQGVMGLLVWAAFVLFVLPRILRLSRARRYQRCLENTDRLERKLFPEWFTDEAEALPPQTLAAAVFRQRYALRSPGSRTICDGRHLNEHYEAARDHAVSKLKTDVNLVAEIDEYFRAREDAYV